MPGLQLPNPPPSSAAARAVMRGNRARDTEPERRLRTALRAAGLGGYRRHWSRAPGRPDICYPGRRVAIFVHGCYWHRCPTCALPMPRANSAFWARKFELNGERDARKRRLLEADGWRVDVVWECEVRQRLSDVVARIAEGMRGRGPA